MKCQICQQNEIDPAALACRDCIKKANLNSIPSDRDRLIYQLFSKGNKAPALADKFGISRARVYQIRESVEAWLSQIAEANGTEYLPNVVDNSFDVILPGFAANKEMAKAIEEIKNSTGKNHSEIMREAVSLLLKINRTNSIISEIEGSDSPWSNNLRAVIESR